MQDNTLDRCSLCNNNFHGSEAEGKCIECKRKLCESCFIKENLTKNREWFFCSTCPNIAWCYKCKHLVKDTIYALYEIEDGNEEDWQCPKCMRESNQCPRCTQEIDTMQSGGEKN